MLRFIRGADVGLVSLGDEHRFGLAESLALFAAARGPESQDGYDFTGAAEGGPGEAIRPFTWAGS